ncbi:MAG: hypothetical protein LBC39_07050 [Methanobrevibacter sp.]|jgi:hypothetical protein|nr:hypothetical protein [Candidatus Methanovirga aequatorialis]
MPLLDKRKNINHRIRILDDWWYGMLKPICPDCESLYHTKHEFRQYKSKVR